MPDITQPRNVTANGTATPATATLAGVVAGDLLICVITAIGTSPTIATPTGDTWVQIQKTQGVTLSSAMYMLANAGAGSHTPSSVLGGTVTGWILEVFEFTATGSNTGLQGSAQLATNGQQFANVFPVTGQTLSNELFVYCAVWAGAANFTVQNSALNSLTAWSPAVLPQSNVQGISLQTFWASGLAQGVGQYPLALGFLAGSGAYVQIAAWFNTIASQPGAVGEWVGGAGGILVPNQYQGMIGG